MPFALLALPALAGTVLSEPAWEWTAIGTSSLIASLSLAMGIRKHSSRRPLALLGVGLAVFGVARWLAHQHGDACCVEHAAGVSWLASGLSVLGGVTLAGAHWMNSRLCRCCHADHGDDCGVGPAE
jgi:hypothetical protein